MPYDVELKRLQPQPTLQVRDTIRLPVIAARIGEWLGEIWRHVHEQGNTPAGPPYTRYHSVDGDRIVLEAGLPVPTPLPGSGRIQPGELPGGDVVVANHYGPYEELPGADSALDAWAAANGRQAAGPNPAKKGESNERRKQSDQFRRDHGAPAGDLGRGRFPSDRAAERVHGRSAL